MTCFRVGVRLGQPLMPGLLVAHRRPGFYLRVIPEARRAGDTLELRSRGPALSIAEVDGLLYLPDTDIDRVRDASDIPALSPGWRQSFAEMLAAHESGTTPRAVEAGSEPGWQGFRPLTVTRLTHETNEVLSIELHAEQHGALPTPLPGQYLMLQVVGASDVAPVRCYSICAVTDSGEYRLAVKREQGGLASSWLHARLRVGQSLQAAAPRGVFTLDSRSDNPVVLISAGIGVTPVLAMLHALAVTDSQRVVWWLHTARDGQHHPFAAEARELLARLPNAHTQVYFSRSGPSEDGIIAGPLDHAALGRLALPVDATVYTCGPRAFMEEIASACRLIGITDVRRELFGSPDAINPGIVGESPIHHPQVPDGAPGDGPLVTFSRSGLSAPWAGQRYASLLEFAEACDVPTRWACRSGVCHVCSTPAVSGAVRYVNDPPMPPPPGEVLLCSASQPGPSSWTCNRCRP